MRKRRRPIVEPHGKQEPDATPCPAPGKRRKVLLVVSVVLLAAWFAVLLRMAIR